MISEQPFTPELLRDNSEAARQFLEIFEDKSFNYLCDWSRMNDFEVRQYAAERLEEVHEHLHAVQFLKARNELQ